MACACHEGYAGYRGNDDSCLHCGCGCGDAGEYRTGNRVAALETIRSSTL
ncbi:MAG: Apre_1838 family putative sactipeptide bacteriocin [Lachnobacterium sp.]|nr:Apre_1838 family putative sactipeptide bacteriocin [Lachnobacterium sp.]